jgi:hypothetical protein
MGYKTTYMINLLMRQPSVVLQDIIIRGAACCDEFLYYRLFRIDTCQLEFTEEREEDKRKFLIPRSPSIDHQEYPPISRRGISVSRAIYAVC